MRRESNRSKIIIISTIIGLVGLCIFIYVSPLFEKNEPKIEFETNGFWNLKDKLKLNIKDESGIKSYRVSIKYKNGEDILKKEILTDVKKDIDLELDAPKFDRIFNFKDVFVIVDAIDNSKWNFFSGNQIRRVFEVVVDRKKPEIEVIANTHAISRGGSAVVVVKVADENIQKAYITLGDEKKFALTPFYKQNYFLAVIAWPVDIKKYKKIDLVAIDKANNISRKKVPFYFRQLKKRNSNINIKDGFIDNVSKEVLKNSFKEIPENQSEVFVKQNSEVRQENKKKIEEVALKHMSLDFVEDFNLVTFKRLKSALTAGHFGQKRHYYYNEKKIDEQWHLGVDWASIKEADIFVNNAGRVIFNDYLGIYGNSIIIDHGYGIQSLYAHTSSSSVNIGEEVERNQKIANTGVSGAVMGDHLHFGVLVQGIEVNPIEWMDKSWVESRIKEVITRAKEVINSK